MYSKVRKLHRIIERKINEAYNESDGTFNKIKIRYKAICQELNLTSEQEINSVLQILSTKIFMFPDQNMFDHDIPNINMKKAAISGEKQGIITTEDKKKFFIKSLIHE
tara:strand:+ start:119 stop:442 length:324 start_codon:yes stop_codon:yes gene_type:complete